MRAPNVDEGRAAATTSSRPGPATIPLARPFRKWVTEKSLWERDTFTYFVLTVIGLGALWLVGRMLWNWKKRAAALSPFRRAVFDDDFRVRLPETDGLVTLTPKGPFVAESKDVELFMHATVDLGAGPLDLPVRAGFFMRKGD